MIDSNIVKTSLSDRLRPEYHHFQNFRGWVISVIVVVKILITRSGQMFQQIALRLHPAGVLYLTLRFTSLKEAYNRSSLPPSHHDYQVLPLFPRYLDRGQVYQYDGSPGPVVWRQS